MKPSAAYWNTTFQPVRVPEDTINNWLVPCRILVILGVVLLFVGGLLSIITASMLPQLVATIGVILWALCGTAIVVIKHRLKSKALLSTSDK